MAGKYFLVLLTLFFMISRVAADTYRDWPNHKDFVLNTSPTGANVSGNQLKFPLLVRLSSLDSTVFNQAAANGADIRFSGVTSMDSIGTHYFYQTEQWDKTNKTAAIWVLVDTLKGNSTSQKIRMFWGKSGAPDSSNSSFVFDTSNDFQGVWHFGEGNNGAANDATINNYDGAASGTTPPADAAGVIGRCRRFDGSTSYFAMNGTAGGKLNFPEGGTYTLSAWVNTSVLNNVNNEIISKGDHQYALKVSDGNQWLFTEFNNTAGWQSVGSAAAAGTWHHVVGMRNGANELIYVDGAMANNIISTYAGTGRVTTFDVNIGKWSDNAGRFFNGTIDEVEISSVARSSDWIKLCYENQRNGSTMVTEIPSTVQAPTSLKYSMNPDTFFVNAAVLDTPTYSGTVDSFTISPSFSAGLNINKVTGAIYGTPTAAKGQTNYLVTAQNAAGKDTETVVITVLGPPSGLNYKSNSLSCVVGTAIVPDTPAVTGTVTSWTISANPSAGLLFNPANGIIYGTPSAATSGPIQYIITAANGAGPVKDTVTISVNTAVVAPSITAQSGNLWAGVNSTFARAWVKASGTAPITYQWSKNAAALVSGTKDTLKLDTVKRADDNSVYVCKVTNGAGTVNSSPCTLHVVAANFSAAPVTGSDTLTVTFTDSSLGAGAGYPLTWSWSFGDGGVSAVQNPTPHFYSTPNTFISRLIVTANGVSDSMKKTITIAALPLKAVLKADTTTGPFPLTVTFSDVSAGTVFTRLWSFGDGATLADTGTMAAVKHTYSKAGAYVPKLTIRGPAGVDSASLSGSIFIYDPNSLTNTIRITGQYSTNKTITVVFSGYSGLSDVSPPPFVDKIELWSKKNAVPSDTIGSSLFKTYTLSQIKAAVAPFTDAIPLTGTYAAMDSLGLMAVILWSTGARSDFNPANGMFIPLRDTTTLINNLAISGMYLSGDSAEIFLDSVSLRTIDTTKIATVTVGYNFTDSGFFTSGFVPPVSAGSLLRAAVNGRYIAHVTNSMFGGETTTVYCAVMLNGINGLNSNVRSTSFGVGHVRPVNQIKLTANAISSSQIVLHWNPMGDSVRIWYGKKQVPLVYNPSDASLNQIPAHPTDSTDTVSGLNYGTLYYFGAQVFGNGLWSLVTPQSSASDTTDTISDTTKINNTAKITSMTFDTITHAIKVGWTVDTAVAGGDKLLVGLAYSLKGWPVGALDVPSSANTVTISGASGSSILKLSEALLFDTIYYAGLWLRRSKGAWSPPVDISAMDTLRTPSFTWQNIKYGDTVTCFAFNQKVRLIDSTADQIIDTLDYVQPSAGALQGFIQISIGFSFRDKSPGPSFYMGLHYDSISSKHAPSEIRIYRYDAVSQSFKLDTNAVFYDTVNHYISVRTNNLTLPFIAMIDTMKPQVNVVPVETDLESAVASGQDITCSFSVADNISNVKCRIEYAKGGSSYDDGNHIDTVLSSPMDTIHFTIIGDFVSADNGLRAHLIVSDGVHIDTTDISRRVVRATSSDPVSTDPNNWCPLSVTAYLDSPAVKKALKVFAVNGAWHYDPVQFRLFRYANAGNGPNDSNKYIEYSDATDSLFTFYPGRLIWIKTLVTRNIDFGGGTTPSLKHPDTLNLQPNTWSDIALPYKFNIRIGDIIDATDSAGQPGDSLQYYFWKYTNPAPNHPQYMTWPLYVDSSWNQTGNTALANRADSVVTIGSIYNPLSFPVKLIVPPIPTSLSKIKATLGKKKETLKGWSMGIGARTKDGAVLNTVYCGYINGKGLARYYPLPPSFDNITISVLDGQKRRFAHALTHGNWNKDGGASFPFEFTNTSGSPQEIDLAAATYGNVPGGNVRIALFDPATGTMSETGKGMRVVVGNNAREFREIVVGSDAYLAKVKLTGTSFRLALVGAYPNPFRRSLRIQYSIPDNSVRQLDFSIVDLSGREIWKAVLKSNALVSGPGALSWDGRGRDKRPTASGLYVVRMTAIDLNGKTSGVFEKRITYMP